MNRSHSATTNSFLERASSMMDRVEHRLAVTADDAELVYQTRYAAYFRQNLIPSRADRRLFDERYDDSPNAYKIMTFYDDEFVSSFRIHVGAGESAVLPSRDDFDDVVMPFLLEGRVVMDLTRIVAKLEFARKFPEIPHLTMRAAWLAARHFDVDIIILPSVAEHQAYYKRVFGFEPLGAPRAFPLVHGAIACMALDYRVKKDALENRLPLLRSTEAERRSIFGFSGHSRPVGGAGGRKAPAETRKPSFAE